MFPIQGKFECAACGEPVFVSFDPAEGMRQTTVYDCPVCCRPNVLEVLIDEGEHEASVRAELEGE